jgi:hypothetical protein
MWKPGQRYELRVASSFTGAAGLSMGKNFTSVFTIGEDTEKPYLLGAHALETDGTTRDLTAEIPGPFRENSLWEKDTKLLLVFSEPVDSASVRSSLDAEGAPSMDLESTPGMASELVFSFRERPSWQSRFLFKLKPGIRDAAGNESEGITVFHIYADGVFSKPPSLVGIRLPMAPGKNAGEQEPAAYIPEDVFADLPLLNHEENFIYEAETPVWIELYFDTAPGAEADIFSLMDLFRVEATNNAVSFSPQKIVKENFSADAQPGWEHYSRVEVRGTLINRINAGMVSFIVGAGLADTLGNRSDKTFKVAVLK